MPFLDFLNNLGKKFESLAMKEEFKVAKAVRNATDSNPIAHRLNSLVDEYRGLIFLLMFLWMLAMAYFIIYYDNGIALRTRAFVGADDACAAGAGNPNGYIISDSMTGHCRNSTLQSGIFFNPVDDMQFNFSCHCANSS